MRLAALILCAAVAPASVRAAEKPFDVRFAETYARHLVKMDADYLADVFRKHEETNLWQTEFWGKYMHSAVPLVKRFPNAELEGHIRSSARIVMDSQLDDGYIGNYREGRRAQGGWDVWGVKYTLMGLLYYHDLTHEERPLACARRLADWLIGEVGPGGKRRIVTTGNYCGMPSCSVLEPIVWLYRETKDRRYLAFAEEIVREVGYDDDGPRLVRQALAGVPVAERGKWTGPWWDGCKDNAMKAYEMMSCYQGLLDYVEEKVKVGGEGEGEGKRLEEIRRAAVMTAEDILAHEINIVGGAGSVEFWYGGAAHETLPYAHQNETCVTITWLRLCQRLFGLTGDEKWRAAFRRTFFNVYLGAISPDCSRFAAYPALQGRRTFYREHCHMTTDCCNQNGMRGYVAALEMGVIAGDTPERVHAVKDPRGAWGLVEKDGAFAVRCGELVMAFVGAAAAIPVEREEFRLDEAKSALVPFAFVGSEVYRTWAEVVRHPWTGKLLAAGATVAFEAEGTPKANAAALQRAIDAASAAGGGRVTVPKGTWTCGTVWLKSGVELHLEKGAVLKASADQADYNALDAYPENGGSPRSEYWLGQHFLICRLQRNVAITGEGTIDGNGDAFFDPEPIRYFSWMTPQADAWWNGIRWSKDKEKLRPGQLVVFIRSTDVRVEGVTIRNSPCWCLFFHGCENVTVRNYTARCGMNDGNTDGLDIDCCRHVRVEDVDIDVGDDAIAIRAAGRRLGAAARPCEDIRIRRAKLASTSSVFRLGVGDGLIRDVEVSDVTCTRGGTGVMMRTLWGDRTKGGVDMADIVFRDCDLSAARLGYVLETDGDRLEFGIRNVTFENCRFGARKGSVSAASGCRFSPEKVVFR